MGCQRKLWFCWNSNICVGIYRRRKQNVKSCRERVNRLISGFWEKN